MEAERQHDLGTISNSISLDKVLLPFKPANYLYSLLIPKHRYLPFTLAPLNALPWAVQEGKYKKIPYTQCRCPCNVGAIETVTKLSCPVIILIFRGNLLNLI